MPIKKSELYRSIWASCDELRGGMDASQYKDYVLVLLFVKYVSDKYADDPFGTIIVPEGASFQDMVRLKGKTDIGDRINKEIIAPLFRANGIPINQAADWNDESKLGKGQEMQDRLTNLIAIFESPELDFSDQGAAGDDILGDAYEYLMRHFAQDSGKSKGQFYTPAEVSRVLARVLDMQPDELGPDTTAYDPTCGSGSLLLKVADEAGGRLSIYGQEKDSATTTLARMNVVLHDMPGALQEIKNGNTLANPQHLTDGRLKQFDFVVANPPFSYKSWTNGVTATNDPYGRFAGFGVPPDKNGDYAWVLHIIKCLKERGRAAVILPHGVLFRGNAEAVIRQSLLERGLLRGIIGLPANLFYGTGIPACILLLDKADAVARRSVFMLDASRGFIKDGNKNRLRARDIHRIVDVFTSGREVPGYGRRVPLAEIAANDYNLNLPRYIDGRAAADEQNIEGHLQGGIPAADIDSLAAYWSVFPALKSDLCTRDRAQFYTLKVDRSDLRDFILRHPEFTAFQERTSRRFSNWRGRWCRVLKEKEQGTDPKATIAAMSEDLLATYEDQPLMDEYAVYQHLLDYWNATLSDDLYLISTAGWLPGGEVYRMQKTTKTKNKTKTTDIKGIDGIESKLLPPKYLLDRYFSEDQTELDRLTAAIDAAAAEQTELAEEHDVEDGAFAELDKVNAASVKRLLKAAEGDASMAAEKAAATAYLNANARESAAKKTLKALLVKMEDEVWTTYGNLSEDDIKTLVVEDKWLAHLKAAITAEADRSSQHLARRLGELADRYARPLGEISREARALEEKVAVHLENMGYVWK